MAEKCTKCKNGTLTEVEYPCCECVEIGFGVHNMFEQRHEIPKCYGDYRIGQDHAERDCEHCNSYGGCMTESALLRNQNYKKSQSDGSTASYYELPKGATELQDIISFLNCNAQMGEIGRAWYRYGKCPHSERQRDLKKIIFYAQAELERLEKYEKD